MKTTKEIFSSVFVDKMTPEQYMNKHNAKWFSVSDVEQLQKEIENKEQILYRNPKNIGVVDIEDIREVFRNFTGK